MTLQTSTRPVLRRAPRLGGLRDVGNLAYPVVLTQISVTTTQLVDSAMVGRLGATELAAVGFAGIWMWTVMCFFMGTTSAVQTFVAQHFGARQTGQCGSWLWQGIHVMLPATAAAAVLLYWFAYPLIAWLGPSDDVVPHASAYLSMRAFGNIGLCAAMALASFFRGIGDTRTPLYAMLLANVVNAVLDYGLIFGELGLPAWGVAGAGLATAIAEWIYFAALLLLATRPNLRARYGTHLWRPSRARIRELLRVGVPIGGQWALEMVSFAVFMTLVAHMGDASLAASQAFIVLLAISFMQAIGIGTAVSTLVGQRIGALDPEAADRSFRSGIKLGLGLALCVAVLFVAVPELLLRVFTDDREVLALARPLLVVGAVFQLFDAIAIVSDGALRGAGDTRWPFLVRFGLSWGVFVPLAWWIGIGLGYGLTGAWVGGAIYVGILAACLVWRFQSGAWRGAAPLIDGAVEA